MLTPRSKKPPRGLISKWNSLVNIIQPLDKVVVAFSGGLDSSLLLAAAVFTLGTQRVRAVTCTGPLSPPWELQVARSGARALGVSHTEVEAHELDDPRIAANTEMRCYWCKRRRMQLLLDMAGDWVVVEGTHVGDEPSQRPGIRALKELGVLSPLTQAQLSKPELAKLARWLGIGWAVRPSGACLATRIPTATPLTLQALQRVARAEGAVRELVGERVQVRVREHWPVARVELGVGGLRILASGSRRAKLVEALKAAGYRRVCLDLEGYQEGGGS